MCFVHGGKGVTWCEWKRNRELVPRVRQNAVWQCCPTRGGVRGGGVFGAIFRGHGREQSQVNAVGGSWTGVQEENGRREISFLSRRCAQSGKAEVKKRIGMTLEAKRKGARISPNSLNLLGVPKGVRTPVAGVRGQCPRPLDDGDV